MVWSAFWLISIGHEEPLDFLARLQDAEAADRVAELVREPEGVVGANGDSPGDANARVCVERELALVGDAADRVAVREPEGAVGADGDSLREVNARDARTP